jgi:hypothetical protein
MQESWKGMIRENINISRYSNLQHSGISLLILLVLAYAAARMQALPFA